MMNCKMWCNIKQNVEICDDIAFCGHLRLNVNNPPKPQTVKRPHQNDKRSLVNTQTRMHACTQNKAK